MHLTLSPTTPLLSLPDPLVEQLRLVVYHNLLRNPDSLGLVVDFQIQHNLQHQNPAVEPLD